MAKLRVQVWAEKWEEKREEKPRFSQAVQRLRLFLTCFFMLSDGGAAGIPKITFYARVLWWN